MWSGSHDRFLNFKPLKYFWNGWSKFGKWIDYGKSHRMGKKSSQKGCGLVYVIVFGIKPRSLNFTDASIMASATSGLKIPAPKWVWCGSSHYCLNFNPFNISAGIRWRESGGVQATIPVLCRIPSLFLNNAWIYSELAVLWYGVAGMSYFASPCMHLFFIKWKETFS